MKFSLFGIPVSVHWSFLIVAVFGFGRFDEVAEIAAWTAAVFVAVLLHESGHAFTARGYGASGVTMTLFALGGLTSWVPRRDMSAAKQFVVSAAGSALGIAAGLALFWLRDQGLFADLPSWAGAFVNTFILVGLFWGVLNWIPLLPLDGGHMLQHGLAIFAPRQAPRIALVVSAVVGAGLIGAAFYFNQPFLAIFLMFIVFSGLRSQPQPPMPSERPAEPAPPVEQDGDPPAFPI
jgi:Zn-dependent protease